MVPAKVGSERRGPKPWLSFSRLRELMAGKPMLWVRIEHPGGPGLDIVLERRRPGPVVTSARRSGTWLGTDRGTVSETDSGDGTPLCALIALPMSASSGVELEAELCGAFALDGSPSVIVVALPGQQLPTDALLRVAGRVAPAASYVDAVAAQRILRRGRVAYRRRRAAGRRTDRPAWLPPDELISATGYSSAEEQLRRLPPRFVRGLRSLLDDDERILAAVERPPEERRGLLDWRHRADRRAGLLVLTDRQLLWLVDHLPPDRYLFDWGVDVQLLPIEALVDARLEVDAGRQLIVETPGGEVRFSMPADIERELGAFVERLRTFLPRPGIRRRYTVESVDLDLALLAPFGQADEAGDRIAALQAEESGPAVAFYAPRRNRVKESAAVLVTGEQVLLEVDGRVHRLRLHCLRAISVSLSPLIGRLELLSAEQGQRLSYPAPLASQATAFIRQLRRAWANT